MAESGELSQQTPGSDRLRLRSARRRCYGRPGYRALAQGRGTAGTEKLVEFAGGQHQQKPFADWLGTTTLGAI